MKLDDGRMLSEHDVSDLIGLNVIVRNTALMWTDADGGTDVFIPNLRELAWAAAVARCLTPVRLRGSEIRAIRKICGWTAKDLGLNMDDGKCPPETVSRWENEKQVMGGYAEKVLRLAVCEELASRAPGVFYVAGKIAHLKIVDPWRAQSDAERPKLVFDLIKVRASDAVVEAWGSDIEMVA